jgi:acyl-CoA thioesterase
MDEEIRSAIMRQVAQGGYAEKLGIRLVDLAPGYGVVESVPREDDANILGTVHGGAIFSLMDEAFQVCSNSHGTVAVAMVVNVVYHKPAKVGRKLRAESREINRSKKTATYEIRVEDEAGVLIASCQALAYRKEERLPFLGETG